MSPNNPGNFVNDLVEMAKAFEALPKVTADLEDARKEIAGLANTVARLEAKLLDRANEINGLQSTVRSREVERDDAQFHALEADDRTSRALDFIKATFGNAGTLIQALEPPRQEPVNLEPVRPAEVTSTPEPEGLHTTQPDEPRPYLDQVSEGVPFKEIYSPSPAPEVAPAHPTPTTDANSTVEQSVTSASSEGTGNATSGEPSGGFSAPPIDRGKYHGLTYSKAHEVEGVHFSWPSKDEWLSDGGSLDDFYA